MGLVRQKVVGTNNSERATEEINERALFGNISFMEWVDGPMTLGSRVWRDILHSQIAKCCNLKPSNKTKLCAAGGCGGDGGICFALCSS